jgi:ABC-2 type transport system ATP-binding protein
MTKRRDTATAVRFEDVTVEIGKRTILDRVSLDISRGEITGILGPNGAGKTTLLRSILGLRRPSRGTITVLDERIPPCSAALRQRTGVVFQETALYDELTSFENLRFAASLYRIGNPVERIGEVLELLGLSERANQRVQALSGGLRRRVAIARALLHAPDLLIVDEPTLGVDVEARHAIWSHLRLLRSGGTTVVIATNYLDEALALCDAVAVLRSGQTLITTTPQALVARAGSCLDIECAVPASEAIRAALTGMAGVLRIEATPIGLSVFLDGSMVAEPVIRGALKAAAIDGFRTRGADLAEVFRALETAPS